MKRSNNIVIAFLLITLLVILASLSSCSLLEYLEPESQQENLTDDSQSAYTFHPDKVLNDISIGQLDVFTILAGTQIPAQRNSEFSVDWSQADFFKVAEAFSEQVWHEPLQDWGISLMFFRLDCHDIGHGPQIFSIDLFKVSTLGAEKSRLLRTIHLVPKEGRIEWIKAKKYPVIEEWSSINLSDINVPVEEALEIAEANGGKEARADVNNQCVIFIQLIANDPNSVWQIDYGPLQEESNLFSYRVKIK